MQIENELIDQVKVNLEYLSKCVHALDAARLNYTESQIQLFRQVLKDEDDLQKLEYETDLDLLSHHEQKCY